MPFRVIHHEVSSSEARESHAPRPGEGEISTFEWAGVRYAQFLCPKCRSMISLHLSGLRKDGTGKHWTLTVADGLPTIEPSIHDTGPDCGGHYFIRRGEVVWA